MSLLIMRIFLFFLFCGTSLHVLAQESIYRMTSVEDVPPEVRLLATEITAESPDDSSRLAAIYHWVTGNIKYDAAGAGGNRINHSVLDVLDRKKAICYGYAQLVQQLCIAVDIPAHVVSGYSGPSGNASVREAPDHAWNAVSIAGQWHLLDATWGASQKPRRKKDPAANWLRVPPERFVASHLPAQPVWQLIDCPVPAIRTRTLPCGYRDTLRHYLALEPEIRKLEDARMAYTFHPSEANRHEYAQTLIDAAIRHKERADEAEPAAGLADYAMAAQLFRQARTLKDQWFDWQEQAYAFALLNQAQLTYTLQAREMDRDELASLRDLFTAAEAALHRVKGTLGIDDALDQCALFIEALDERIRALEK